MVEIPEHLRKRAEEARAKAEAARGGGDGGSDAGGDAGGGDSGIPSELLERSKAARARAEGGDAETAPAAAGGGGTAVVTAPAAATPTGPGGHTQRLLTVVKAGSIQDVKATPIDKVHTWPHLLAAEFVASLAMTAFV